MPLKNVANPSLKKVMKMAKLNYKVEPTDPQHIPSKNSDIKKNMV